MTRTHNPWFSQYKPKTHAEVRLFCLPYAGGTALIYRKWPEILPPTIDVCALQPPGRGNRIIEPAFNRIEDLVKALVEVMRPYLDKPFALFGHSMGALISFELARCLRREVNLTPQQLFFSGHRAPQLPDPDPPTYNLPEKEFLAELRRLNGTPPEALENSELMQLMIPLLRADFALCQTYIYTIDAPFSCPISVFGGLQDIDVSRANLEAWRTQTTSNFSLHMFPGDHFYLHQAQPTLLQLIAQQLHKFAKP